MQLLLRREDHDGWSNRQGGLMLRTVKKSVIMQLWFGLLKLLLVLNAHDVIVAMNCFNSWCIGNE